MVLAGAAASIALPGCYIYTDPVPTPASAEITYEPVYYEGNVVYYDDIGEPYVVIGDTIQYVPRTYVQYGFYVNHYHRYGGGYHHWVRSHAPRHAPMRHHRR